MMDHIKVPTEIAPLVLDSIKAMWARRDDLRDVVSVERLNVLADQCLRKILIAHTPCRIAGTFFLCSENAKIDIGRLHNLGKCLGDLFYSCIIRTRATDPE